MIFFPPSTDARADTLKNVGVEFFNDDCIALLTWNPLTYELLLWLYDCGRIVAMQRVATPFEADDYLEAFEWPDMPPVLLGYSLSNSGRN